MMTNTDISDLQHKSINDQTSKRLGDNIPQYMQHSEKELAGFFFGIRKTNDGSMHYIGKPQNKDGHILVIGGPGSGKSSCIAIPTLTTWNGTIFAIDIKGELFDQYSRLKSKRPVKVFRFSRDTAENCSYDPFNLLHEGDPDDLVQNAREIAQAIIPIPPNIPEPFWCQAAQHVLTAVILYVCGMHETDEDTGKTIEGTFNHAMTLIQTEKLWELIDEIGNSENEAANMHIKQFREIVEPEDNKMLTAISAELSNRIIPFATDNRIKSAFTKGDNMIRWEDLETQSIFMQIPEDKIGQWDSAITLMLTQLIRTLERRPDKYSTNGKKQSFPPVLLLLDEFPRLGKIDVIQNAISTLRSKNVTICLMMQSLSQLDKTYGIESRKIIMDNCQYKAILNVTDPDNQKIFSDMIGSINVEKRSTNDRVNMDNSPGTSSSIIKPINCSDSRDDKISTSISTNRSTTREPVIFPHELATLKDILLMTPEGFCRVYKLPYYCKETHYVLVDFSQKTLFD